MVYTPPLEDLLKWPTPNYENPETRGPEVVIVNSVFLAFATLFIVLRLYTRLFVRKWFGIDDVFILIAYAATIAFNAITIEGVAHHGWNRHSWDVPLDMVPMSSKLAFFSKLCYVVASMFIAYSLLTFYYRLIAESGTHWFRMALHITMAFNIGVWTSMFFAEIFICSPVQYYWQLTGPPGAKCHYEGPVTFAFGVMKTIIEAVVTSLPLPLILQMEMRQRQRYMVSGLFALGYVVTGAGIARTYFTYKAFFDSGYDIAWWQMPVFMSSTIENNLAIICACAPTIRPLFPKLLGGPLHKVKGWITTHTPTSKNSRNMSSDPKRSSNLSAMGSRMRTRERERDRDLEGLSDSDVELVIQKNSDQGQQTTVTTRSNSDGGFDFDIPEQPQASGPTKPSTIPAGAGSVSRALKGLSGVTVGSGSSRINPFDPRLDAEDDLTKPAYGRSR